jgi:acetyl-CoA C-acetyltransferase
MEDAYILSGVRTPIGAFLGALATLTAPQLGAAAIREAVKRAGIEPPDVEEVIMGCVLTGGMGQAPARQAALHAGLPDSVPCTTVNKVCGSSLKSLLLAAQSIRLHESRIAIAGGMESMSNAPYIMDRARTGFRMGHATVVDSMIHDGLWDPYNNMHMGNCGDRCAREYQYTRAQVDDYAAESYRRALAAQQSGRLKEEIVPVAIPQRKGEPVIVDADEEPGKGDPGKLAALRPAFGKDGVTTAGNASSIDDGAAAMVLASRSEAEKRRLQPLGRVVASATHAQDPQWFTTAPVFAVRKLLSAQNLSVPDIDLFEVNEAFSVVAMVTADQVGIPREKLNVNGGAVSLGHPIGMSGARLIINSLYELRRRAGRYAIVTACIGGGEAIAVLLESVRG